MGIAQFSTNSALVLTETGEDGLEWRPAITSGSKAMEGRLNTKGSDERSGKFTCPSKRDCFNVYTYIGNTSSNHWFSGAMSHLLVSGRVSNHFDFEDLRQSPRIPRISVSLDHRFQRKITTQRVPYKGSTWSTCPRLVEKRFPQAATDQEVGSPVKFEASGGGSLKCLGEGGFPGARGGMGKRH